MCRQWNKAVGESLGAAAKQLKKVSGCGIRQHLMPHSRYNMCGVMLKKVMVSVDIRCLTQGREHVIFHLESCTRDSERCFTQSSCHTVRQHQLFLEQMFTILPPPLDDSDTAQETLCSMPK